MHTTSILNNINNQQQKLKYTNNNLNIQVKNPSP